MGNQTTKEDSAFDEKLTLLGNSYEQINEKCNELQYSNDELRIELKKAQIDLQKVKEHLEKEIDELRESLQKKDITINNLTKEIQIQKTQLDYYNTRNKKMQDVLQKVKKERDEYLAEETQLEDLLSDSI